MDEPKANDKEHTEQENTTQNKLGRMHKNT